MGIGNKLLNGKIRHKIGNIVIKKLKENSISINNITDEKEIKKIKYNNEEMFLCKIKNGKIYSSWGFYFTEDNKLIKETLPFENIIQLSTELGGRFVFYKFRKKIKIKNLNVFSLQSIWNVCFGHWIHETLPKLFILKDLEYLDKIDVIVLGDGCKSKFHKESLKLFGLENKKIVYISDETEIKCDNLYLSKFPSNSTHYPLKWICDKYKELAKEIIKKYDINKFPKKIYLTRKNVKTRRILNEDKLINDLLLKIGYTIIVPEEYSLEEQFCLFYNAEKIISVLGSGLTNLVCSKSDTSVLGICPKIRYEDTYKYILETIGGKYIEYIEEDESHYIYHNNHNKHNDFDFYINLEKFKETLEIFENI